jgi:CubicO group peptidase (beta-lactamase class C family)
MHTAEIKKGILPESNSFIRYLVYIVRNRFRKRFEKKLFLPHILIRNRGTVFDFNRSHRPNLFSDFYIHGDDRNSQIPFDEALVSSGTTAFIVIRDDTILYEKYLNGFSRDSLFRVYSISKSFLSALVGVTLQEGAIQSVNEPVTKYIPEFESGNLGELTIANLLRMDSGIGFNPGYAPWKDQIKSYFCRDCRKLISRIRIKNPVGRYFHYNDYHSLLLIRIIEKAIGSSVISYFEKKLWQPLEMEFPAVLYCDSTKYGLPKFESGLSVRPIDLAKFGRLFLNQGNWNGHQILSKTWIEGSTKKDPNDSPERYSSDFIKPLLARWFQSGRGYYQYHWWGNVIDQNIFDYFALGIFGQFLYISSRKKCIVIRLGTRKGIRNWWPNVLKKVVDRISSN